MSATLTQLPAARRVTGQYSSARQAAQPTASIRLTRRGRFVFGALGVFGAAASLALIASLSAAPAIAANEGSGATFGYVVAAPGASLWQLATELDPSMDPRDLVAEIVHLNQLQGSDVVVGQSIAVPLRYTESPAVMSADELGL
ncbi:hypothetical protein JOF28_002793 [Leucobacter exalbidus]|uniref:LysM domain-containing protein n=1 Tax=Leucobacter exalbidus TaxID=662960 RepID=A0A940PYV5_9MICO|nr:hypothetical protein [Leucobacter exalbidus]MBP1327561.1 hypothetical protein [Leucobacter exalbidus]